MKLGYHIAGAKDDLGVYLRGMSPGVQGALRDYNGKLLSLSVTPDGNRRFSRHVKMNHVVEGHKEGVERLKDTLIHLRDKRSNVVDEALFWGLSRQNKNRPEDELRGLFKLIEDAREELLQIASEKGVHVFMVGDESLLPPDIVDMMADISDRTEQFHSTFRCALALAYDQTGEETRQRQILIDDGFQGSQKDLQEEAFEQAHKGLREPDVMIRAGSEGRHRTSGGFMGPNTALHFFRAHWPTITTKHIDFALHSAIMEEINNGK